MVWVGGNDIIHVSQRDGTQGDIRALEVVTDNVVAVNDGPIEQENRIRAERDACQKQIFRNILMNVDTTKVSYCGMICRGLAGIVLGFLVTGSVTLVPQHNITDEADYWYEGLFTIVFGWIPMKAAQLIPNVSYCMNTDCIKTVRKVLVLYSTLALFMAVLVTAHYYIWTYGFNYNYPMPFQALVLGNLLLEPVTLLQLWFLFPKDWRQDKGFRSRLKFFYARFLATFLFTNLLQILKKLFVEVPSQYQWIVGIIVLIVREVHQWIMIKLSQKASGCNSWTVDCSTGFLVKTMYAQYLAVILGSVATNETSALILGIDFLLNIYQCLKIVYLEEENRTGSSEQIAAIQELVLSEHVEFVLPITYFICFLAGFYGPNAELIGNIKFAGWS